MNKKQTTVVKEYKRKARIWEIRWEDHEIRYEYLTPRMSDYSSPYSLLFVEGKCVAKSYECVAKCYEYVDKSYVSANIQRENGEELFIECVLYNKFKHFIQQPLSKSFWGRISHWIDNLLPSYEYNLAISVNEELVYLSHIGDANAIEKIKQEGQRG